jgi:hypothetical protein
MSQANWKFSLDFDRPANAPTHRAEGVFLVFPRRLNAIGPQRVESGAQSTALCSF